MKSVGCTKGMLLAAAAGLALTLTLLATGANAADGDFVWAKRMGGTNGDYGYEIAVDGAGNVYITGSFRGTADFDPGAGTFNLTAAGSGDIFVSKLDVNGDFVWAKAMGGTDYDFGYGVAADGAGNVYTTGSFQETVDFDPGAGTFNLTAAGSSGIFVSKLDVNGDFVWAKAMGGTSYDHGGRGIAVDGAGNVYTTGCFWGTADFDPGAGTFNLTAAGIGDIFVSKLDAGGDFVWAKAMGGTNGDYGYEIAVDGAGNVYTTGYFQDTADFDPGAGTFNLTPGGSANIFVSKLDAGGDFVWAKTMGGAGSSLGYGIAVDGAGNVYTTGAFEDTADFDPGAGTFNLTPAGSSGIFVSKLDVNGDFVWAKAMGGTDYDAGKSVAVDGAGNVYTTGYFQDTADFDPGAGAFNLTSAGDPEIFVSKLNANGDFVWAKAIRGTSTKFGEGIAMDGAGNAHTTGYFVSTADFDPGTGTFNLTSAGSADIFVLKLLALPTANTIATTASPTNADTVSFDVHFSEDVQNFDGDADLVITETGTVAHTGVAISGGPQDYTVDLTGVSGDGEVTLAVSTGSDVQDLAGNPLDSSVTSAPVVIDNTPPIVSVGPPSAETTVTGPVDYTVSYLGETTVTLSPGDITLDVTGGVAATVSVSPAKDSDYTVTLSDITGVGTLGFTIAPGTATDAAGNPCTGVSTAAQVTVENGLPLAAWPAAVALLALGAAAMRKRRK